MTNYLSLKCPGAEGRLFAEPEPATCLGEVSRQCDSMPPSSSRDVLLSVEERQIVALIVAGYTNKDIARHFSRSESTIHRRVIRVFAKLGVGNKLEMVLFAVSHGIVTRPPNDAA